MTTIPRPPKGMTGRASRLWRALHEVLEFDPHETQLLIEACRALQRIDELEAAVAEHGVMVPGSTGQLVVNPAVAEQRQQQATLARLVTLLGIDLDPSSAPTVAVISQQARRAAEARWARSKGARGA